MFGYLKWQKFQLTALYKINVLLVISWSSECKLGICFCLHSMFVCTYRCLKWDIDSYWCSISLNNLFLNNIHSFIHCCLSYDRSIVFRSQFSIECILVLLLPISRIPYFPEGHPKAAYIFFLIFPSLLFFPLFFPSILCFRRQFLHKMWPIQWAFLIFIVCRMHRSSLTVCNTSSFLTWSVQLIFSVLYQHHIS
jgi:hypothetical protein